ncbi:MAG: hypothetical protein ACYDEN_14570 [Acidimicrobiales bacterium]
MDARSIVRSPGRRATTVLCLGAVGVLGAACSIHISKNGISGNIAGHSFSAVAHALPSGFPTAVPVPDGSRVIGGAGTNGDFDAVFGVPGTVTAGAAAYESKFRSAGFTVTVTNGPSTTQVTGSGQNSTSTTVTFTGATFTAKNGSWTVQVEMGSSSSAVSSQLKAGEIGVNITVVPTTSTSG